MWLPKGLIAGIRIQEPLATRAKQHTNTRQQPGEGRKCSAAKVRKQDKENDRMGYGNSCPSTSVVGVVIAVEKECEVSALFGVVGKLLEGSLATVTLCTKQSSSVSFGSSVSAVVKGAGAGVGAATITGGTETGVGTVIEVAAAITIGLASLGLLLGATTLPVAILRSSFGGRYDEVLPVDDGLIGVGARFAEDAFENASSEDVREGILDPCEWFVLALGVFR